MIVIYFFHYSLFVSIFSLMDVISFIILADTQDVIVIIVIINRMLHRERL